MAGFFGGGNAVEGFSPNSNERQQRLNEMLSRLSAAAGIDQEQLMQFFTGGGPWEQGAIWNAGAPIFGNYPNQPQGPAFNLVNQGLQGEEDLSQLRQQAALRALSAAPYNSLANEQFQHSAINQGRAALATQGALRNQNIQGTFGDNLNLSQQLTGGLQDFFASGGAPSDAQRQAIAGIYDPQREIAYSNLNQQFNDRLRQANDQFSARGLRNSDTPAQELTGRTIDEFGRQAANVEANIGSQQSAALLNEPFRQATMGGQLQGQTQANLLNLINNFSQSIGQGFNAGQQLSGLNQFGLQYTPASASGASLQNLMALVGGSNPAPNQPVFTSGVPQNPSFGQQFGGAFASSLGSGLGGAATLGASSLVGGLGAPQTPQINPSTGGVGTTPYGPSPNAAALGF